MIVDAFAHILPREFAKDLMDVWPSPELAAVARLDYFWDIERRLTVLNELGIDVQVVTLARPDIWLRCPQNSQRNMLQRPTTR